MTSNRGPLEATKRRGPLEVVFAAVPKSGGHARDTVRAFVNQADREELASDAALIVSELVTNAVRYTSGTIRLKLDWESEDLRIEVHDTNPAPPTMSQASRTAVGGRGLHIVNALADEWGFDLAPTGKTVWASLQ